MLCQYGLAGIVYVDIEVNTSASLGTISASASDSKSDTSFAWGLGASYAFNQNWGANLEYISLNEEADIQSINLGLTYHF